MTPHHHTSLKARCYVCGKCCALHVKSAIILSSDHNLKLLRHSRVTWAFAASSGHALHSSFRVMAALVPPSDTCQHYAVLLRWVHLFYSLLLSSVIVRCFVVSHPVWFSSRESWGTGFSRQYFGNLMFLLLDNSTNSVPLS